MNYIFIIAAFLIVVIIYMLYYYYSAKSLTSGIVNLNSAALSIGWENIESPTSPTFNYEGWVFITTNSQGKNIIFNRGSDFALALNGNALEVYVSSSGNTFTISNHQITAGTPIMVVTDNFPFQKWVYFTINVNDKIMEVYLNGKLVKTIKMSNSPNITQTASISTGTGKIQGYITRFSRGTKVLEASEIWKNYISGNGTGSVIGSLSKYNINMSILKGEQLQKELSLF
jgi:hypothetical protein